MVLLAHYNLELHQMNVKTAFLNGDLYEKHLYGTTQKFFVMEEKNIWDAAYRNPFMSQK